MTSQSSVLPQMIEVVPSSPTWPASFASISSSLRSILHIVPIISIEHIGSTSVPGLPAKPVIDIDIIVAPSNLHAALAALSAAGYVHRGDLGVPGREALAHPTLAPGEIKRNIYVCVNGCTALRNHLAVRDVLRSTPSLRDAYGEIKMRLAAQVGMELDRYVAGKSDVLQQVLRAAPDGMFTEEELREIFNINAT